jgi:hypothetical protein
MKKITLLLIALALVVSCTSEKKETKPTLTDEDVMSIPGDATPVEAAMAADATPIAPVVEPVMDATPVAVAPVVIVPLTGTNEGRAKPKTDSPMEAMK